MSEGAADRTLILASGSPSRLATLRAAGIEPVVVVSGVDESQVTEPEAGALAARLATLKAEAVESRLGDAAGRFVLGCDSVLEVEGAAYGKPSEADVARERWRAMRGKRGLLHTGHHLIDRETSRAITRSVATVLHFAEPADVEIDAYVASGEPLQVAGAFTIEGRGGAFVRSIEGDPHNVMGLSLPVLREMFAEFGVTWTDLWNR